MSCLLVFDGSISPGDIGNISVNGESAVTLFPLTGKQHIISQVMAKCYAGGAEKVDITATGRIVDEVADEIRSEYIEFIANLPDRCRINNKNLKEWFYYPDGGISLWWLSLVAEKNTFKSDSFSRLVQLYSVIKAIKEQGIRKLIMGCRSRKLESVISLYCQQNALSCRLLPHRNEPVISKLMRKLPAIGALTGAGLYLLREFRRWIQL